MAMAYLLVNVGAKSEEPPTYSVNLIDLALLGQVVQCPIMFTQDL